MCSLPLYVRVQLHLQELIHILFITAIINFGVVRDLKNEKTTSIAWRSMDGVVSNKNNPRSFYRQKYFESCDLLVQELNDRFFQRDVKPIITLESLLMKSANGDSCVQELSDMKESIFSTDACMDKLENQLRIVVDVIRVELPEVKKVTSIRTICDAMAQHVNKDLLSEVHLLLRLYLTFPITSST